MVLIPVYSLFSSCWLRLHFCPVVALEPSMFPTSLDHCLDTLSNYGPGREPCADKVFSLRPGVLSGFVFQRRSPEDTTLSEPRQTRWFLQGWHVLLQLVYNWSIHLVCQGSCLRWFVQAAVTTVTLNAPNAH